jgi:hypothetical protein
MTSGSNTYRLVQHLSQGFPMPSLKPRLALTLPEHRHDLLKRLAVLQGVSMASVVTDLLEECYPVLERVVVALEAAKSASESAKTGLRESCDRAIDELEPYRDQFLGQWDMFMDGITRQAQGAGERAGRNDAHSPAPSAPSVNPRVVTRGSGSPDTPPIPHVRKSRKASGKGVFK